MRLLRNKKESWSQTEKKGQETIKDQVQVERDIKIERAHRSGKTMIDGASNNRGTIIAKFLNFKDKWEVLSEYKAPKLWTKGIFINEDTMEKRKGHFQRAKQLREERKFAKVAYDKLIVHNRRSRLENAEEGDSNV